MLNSDMWKKINLQLNNATAIHKHPPFSFLQGVGFCLFQQKKLTGCSVELNSSLLFRFHFTFSFILLIRSHNSDKTVLRQSRAGRHFNKITLHVAVISQFISNCWGNKYKSKYFHACKGHRNLKSQRSHHSAVFLNTYSKWGVICCFWALNKDELEWRQSDAPPFLPVLAQCLGLLPLPSSTA